MPEAGDYLGKKCFLFHYSDFSYYFLEICVEMVESVILFWTCSFSFYRRADT